MQKHAQSTRAQSQRACACQDPVRSRRHPRWLLPPKGNAQLQLGAKLHAFVCWWWVPGAPWGTRVPWTVPLSCTGGYKDGSTEVRSTQLPIHPTDGRVERGGRVNGARLSNANPKPQPIFTNPTATTTTGAKDQSDPPTKTRRLGWPHCRRSCLCISRARVCQRRGCSWPHQAATRHLRRLRGFDVTSCPPEPR